jgi:hypothetical protein
MENDYNQKEIEKNIKTFLTYGEVVKWTIIILSSLTALAFMATNVMGGPIGLVILTVGIVSAIVTSAKIKWYGYTLRCLNEKSSNNNIKDIDNEEN